jgi:hypothetical protein
MPHHDYLMTGEEINLRDDINRELERLGFHLRVSTLHANTDEAAFDYLQPVGEWIKELSDVDPVITNTIKEWQRVQN